MSPYHEQELIFRASAAVAAAQQGEHLLVQAELQRDNPYIRRIAAAHGLYVGRDGTVHNMREV